MTRAERFCAIVANWDTLTAPSESGPKCTDLYRGLRAFLEDTGRMHSVEPDLIPR